MKNVQPPRWATRLLHWLGHPDTLEEVEGDLLELYGHWVQTHGTRRTNWRYCLSALRLLRPFAQPKHVPQYATPLFFHPDMLQNYLKIAWRTMARNKVYSAINIVGLAVGMAVAMLIGLWIWDELSYNKYHQNYDRIAQVMRFQTLNGEIQQHSSMPIPLATEIRNNYPHDFEHVVISSWTEVHVLAYGDKSFTKPGNFMDSAAPEMLTLTMLKGRRTGLEDPASILLSESVAKALFGETDPTGKLVKLDNKTALKVTGVYQDFPHNSDFNQVTFLAPWSWYLTSQAWINESQQEWDQNSFQIFAQLAPRVDINHVSGKIKHLILANRKDVAHIKPAVFLYPMSQWHLYSDFKNGVNVGGRIQFVWLFGIIGGFVLLLACINFMNLSTAHSQQRAKEVGIRKAIGSVRSQLIAQFFSESLLVVAVAFVLSLALVLLGLPLFNELAAKNLFLVWNEPFFWLCGLGFSLLTGLVAGSYPAFYLSAFQPVKVLKGTLVAGRFAALPRKVLVVLQFTVSVTLTVGTLTVYRQIQHAQNRPVGYNRTGLLTLQLTTPNVHEHFEAVRTDLLQSGAVTEVAESQSPTTEVWSNNGGFSWPGKDPNLQTDFATIGITFGYGKTVGWQFKAGRDFSRTFSTDSAGFVLNEAAIKFMGLKNPVGKTIQWGGNDFKKSFKVLGVIKDMVMSSPYEPVKQTVFYIMPYNGNFLNVRISPTISASEAMPKIEAVFKKYNPGTPFDYKFVDQEYAAKFAAEERIGNLATVFAILTIFISCLGLFGLASFMAEARTKEIGVRKVLGASVLHLWGLLSKDFVVLVIIAVGIATPIAYYFLSNWLQKYDYHTDLSWWIFAASGLGALLITLLTVSFQSIKAALMNPVKSLRSE